VAKAPPNGPSLGTSAPPDQSCNITVRAQSRITVGTLFSCRSRSLSGKLSIGGVPRSRNFNVPNIVSKTSGSCFPSARTLFWSSNNSVNRRLVRIAEKTLRANLSANSLVKASSYWRHRVAGSKDHMNGFETYWPTVEHQKRVVRLLLMRAGRCLLLEQHPGLILMHWIKTSAHQIL